jgi:hypothetical protein
MALIFSSLFLIPITKSSIQRWIGDIGTHLPAPEEMLRHLLALTPVTECHLDGYYPLGTDPCVLVVKDEHDRILMTHEAASENGDDARKCLQKLKDLGRPVTAAFADYSQSFTEAIKAVYPQARLQADHFHTVKNVWGHLKKSLLSSRRQVKANGEAQQDEACLALAKKLWTLRWSLLKKPGHLSGEEKQAITKLESEEEGFVHSFRHIIGQLVNIFDIRTVKRKLSSACNNSDGISTLWKTIILPRFHNSLTLTGSTPCGSCGKKAWASTGVDPTQSQECGCCDGWRRTTTASGLPPPGNITFRSIRRSSTSPSTLPSL